MIAHGHLGDENEHLLSVTEGFGNKLEEIACAVFHIGAIFLVKTDLSIIALLDEGGNDLMLLPIALRFVYSKVPVEEYVCPPIENAKLSKRHKLSRRIES